MLFRGKYGRVAYEVGKLHGCCAVSVVYDVQFDGVSSRKKLYPEFQKHLMTANSPRDLNRSQIMMSDRVRGSSRPPVSIYDFCSQMGWTASSPHFNGLSGNDVVVFTHLREVHSSDQVPHPRQNPNRPPPTATVDPLVEIISAKSRTIMRMPYSELVAGVGSGRFGVRPHELSRGGDMPMIYFTERQYRRFQNGEYADIL